MDLQFAICNLRLNDSTRDMSHFSFLADVFRFEMVEQWLIAGGYFILFGLLFACGLGLPLPEDIPLLLAGYFVSQPPGSPGKMQLWIAAVCAWCGIIGGDCVLYSLGKRYGLNITRVPFVGKHVTKERIEKAERLFERYGVMVVAVARLVAGIRGAMVVAAGTIRYNFVKFVIADGLAALISGGLWIWLGWWIGRKVGSVGELRDKIKPYSHWALVVTLGLIFVLVLYMIWRYRKHETVTEAVIEKVEQAAAHHHSHGSEQPKTEG